MTRELNVRITLSECEGSAVSDESYEDIIRDAILAATMDYQVCVEVHTVTPESAKCRWYLGKKSDLCMYDNQECPFLEKDRIKCRYYEPKREEK